ncbi:hypothetical protein BK133_05925 [Paenibacillus sp. FSL H8-0548]|uniref:hypothetical protein n=1 Tax=Paenibacillus sp. FSL H8-0548 TaxID=1920422 RepID=UPI00096CF38F|nr:hypothetical protein [Paenibacillus sp. FSL H8-0548]OMF37586.1 hypothetical protein BK133_05925 [Paenibacillus sp. FSL H8-0548]
MGFKRQLLLALVLVCAFVVWAPSVAVVHIVNANNLYGDIENVAAKEDIVYLTGINVIVYDHGSPLFRPQDYLTRVDLAYWAGTFYKLGDSDKTEAEISQIALDNGLITDLQGRATYGDVNQAFFKGMAEIDHAEDELTREQYAEFMGSYLTTPVNGRTLLEIAGYLSGPTGVVEEIITHEDKTTELMIDGQQIELAAHPRVLQASTDASLWVGLTISDSWMMETDGGTWTLQILDFSIASADVSVEPTIDELPAESLTEINVDPHGGEHQMLHEGEKKKGSLPVLVIAVVLVVVIFAWLMYRRLRKRI